MSIETRGIPRERGFQIIRYHGYDFKIFGKLISSILSSITLSIKEVWFLGSCSNKRQLVPSHLLITRFFHVAVTRVVHASECHAVAERHNVHGWMLVRLLVVAQARQLVLVPLLGTDAVLGHPPKNNTFYMKLSEGTNKSLIWW